MTVKDVFEACKEQIAKGNGNKAVLISNDDEGNGFHEMFYLFTDDPKTIADTIEYCNVPRGTDARKVVFLG